MNFKKITPLLQTSKPIEIFKKIVAFNEATEFESKKGMVRIGLSSGLVLEGTPLKMDSDKNVIFTTMKNSISYMNIQSLASVEVLNPEALLEILTNGDFFEVPQDAVPTNLQLKRTFKSQSDEMESSYGFKVSSELLENGLSTEAEKYQFEQFLKVLQQTLEIIAEDKLGKEALSDLKEMNINSDNHQIAIVKTNNQLKVGINFKNKFSTDFKDQLKVAFESNL
ncbi:MAG: hypothetical protein AB8B59_15820 [Maribacter sp.]